MNCYIENGYLGENYFVEDCINGGFIMCSSLNGNGSEFKDGVLVTVLGRGTVYIVERSFFTMYSDNAYTIHYDLISDDGYKLTVPEALLTKYTVAV